MGYDIAWEVCVRVAPASECLSALPCKFVAEVRTPRQASLNLVPTHTVLYRVIRGNQATTADFTADSGYSKKPRPRQRIEPLTWMGVSVYARQEDAEEMAIVWDLGSHLAL